MIKIHPLVVQIFTFSLVTTWDLSSYNITPNYYISSIATFGNRAFLALPRSACYNSFNYPTLVEVSWYESQIYLPRKKSFFHEFQRWNHCDDLQDAISLDLENWRSRLWILDKGNKKCFPKIAIYDLFQKINYTADAPAGIPQNKLNFLVVDTDGKLNDPRAYIGLDGESYLLVFSLMEFQWRKINLREAKDFSPISTKYLAFSRKEDVLYLTGAQERSIFSLDLSLIRQPFADIIDEVNVTYRGEKLGNSSALLADLKAGLYYYIPRDYVVVRWDTRFVSEAEHYNVIGQSYEKLPYVSQLYNGPQNGIWAVVNYGDPTKCDIEDDIALDKRLVKLLKYNNF